MTVKNTMFKNFENIFMLTLTKATYKKYLELQYLAVKIIKIVPVCRH